MKNPVIEYLKRHFAYGYEKSKHKYIYEEIANTYTIDPKDVYKIAHGADLRCFGTNNIIDDLFRKGLLHYN